MANPHVVHWVNEWATLSYEQSDFIAAHMNQLRRDVLCAHCSLVEASLVLSCSRQISSVTKQQRFMYVSGAGWNSEKYRVVFCHDSFSVVRAQKKKEKDRRNNYWNKGECGLQGHVHEHWITTGRTIVFHLYIIQASWGLASSVVQ